jgi:hypothetical protein
MPIRDIRFNNNLDHKLTKTHTYGRLRPKSVTGVEKDVRRLVEMSCSMCKTSFSSRTRTQDTGLGNY